MCTLHHLDVLACLHIVCSMGRGVYVWLLRGVIEYMGAMGQWGEADTRYLHDRQMPPPSHAYSMAQNGQAEPGAGVGARGPNSEPVGTATAGARALGPPEVPQGFPAPPNLLALPPQVLESLGPLVSQFMSAHSMQGLASLQVPSSLSVLSC
jgi:hypothetical protein